MCGVHFVFVLAQVVRERDFPALPFQTQSHQPDTGEEFSKRAVLRQRKIDHCEFLAPQQAKRTQIFRAPWWPPFAVCRNEDTDLRIKRCLVARHELRPASNEGTLRAFRNADRFTTFKIFRRPGALRRRVAPGQSGRSDRIGRPRKDFAEVAILAIASVTMFVLVRAVTYAARKVRMRNEEVRSGSGA